MSRAACSVTPKSGIAVSGSTPRGSRIQCTMWSGVLVSTPAMYARSPRLASGGPTRAFAPRTPSIVWHDPQPYAPSAARPRVADPPLVSAAARLRLAHPVLRAEAARAEGSGQDCQMSGVPQPSR